MSRMQDKYNKEVAPALMEKFSYKSTMQIPKLDKIVINIGMGEAKDNPKAIEAACGDLAAITGQKPIITKAKKSVANFKLREGMNIGCKVTLRADKMYEFLDRFFNVALPRVRDLEVLTLTVSTVEVTILLVLRNSLYSLKLTMIRLTKSEVWTSTLSQLHRQTKKLVNF